MKRLRKTLAIVLSLALIVIYTSPRLIVSNVKAAATSTVTENRINLFSGSKAAGQWSQVLTFDTTNSYGGTFDPSIIKAGGYFEAACTGDTTGLQMIFQSWIGGEGWAIVTPSEVATAADGSRLVRFTYDDITASYGKDVDLLNRIYFNTTSGAITLTAFDYVESVTEPIPTETVTSEPEVSSSAPVYSEDPIISEVPEESEDPIVSEVPEESEDPIVSEVPEESEDPIISEVPEESEDPIISEVPEESEDPIVSEDPIESEEPSIPADAINLFTGNTEIAGNTQGGRFATLKNGGVLDGSLINKDGYFAVSYTGSNTIQLVFSSWSGGEGWAAVGNTAVIRNGYKNYTAIFDYDTVAAVYGDNFSALDAIYIMNIGTQSSTLLSVDYVPSGVAAAIDRATPSIAPTVEPSYVAGNLAERSVQASKDYVKVIGRTYVDNDGTRWFTNTASGVEFTYTGTEGSVTLQTSAISDESNQARVAIYVNNVLTADVMMDEMEKTVDFLTSDTAKAVTVRIIKLSESPFAPFAIKTIDVTSTADIEPTAQKQYKIEFIGDSITCGYGVDDENVSGGFKTATENGSKTYAYKTAEALGADYSIVAASGFGIISGYTTSELNSAQTIPPYYSNLGFSWYPFADGSNSTNIAWDFNEFQPDAVVINLGTNDNSYCGSNESRKAEYVAGYVEFLKDIRAKNPNATIFCTLGIMGQELFPQIEEAVAQYTAETGDTNVTSMEFDVQQVSDTICVDWHPSEKTHQKAANALIDYMKYIMNW